MKNYDILAIGAPQDTPCDIFLLTNIELMFYYCPAQENGSAEGRSPFAGGMGVSPTSFKVPQDWGIQGVEKTLLNALDNGGFTWAGKHLTTGWRSSPY